MKKIKDVFLDWFCKIFLAFFCIWLTTNIVYNVFFKADIAARYAELTKEFYSLGFVNNYNVNDIRYTGAIRISKCIRVKMSPKTKSDKSNAVVLSDLEMYFTQCDWNVEEKRKDALYVSNDKYIITIDLDEVKKRCCSVRGIQQFFRKAKLVD